MQFHFWKMHGAGNDMVLVDDRERRFPAADRAWLARLGARRTGIGCDGFILIQPGGDADFAMRFFNPDGGEAEMCGNGARCVARLAHDLGIAGARMCFQTVAGPLRAEIVGSQVRLYMTTPHDWRLRRRLQAAGAELEYSFVNSGVPHAMVTVPDLAAVDMRTLGAAIRRHPDFAPKGTNANFVAVTGPNALGIRTFERGVEDETLACGTGMVASACLAGVLGLVRAPVTLTCASGDQLQVDYALDAQGQARDVTLLGPAEYVFEGELAYSG